jgi:hypothetical protein
MLVSGHEPLADTVARQAIGKEDSMDHNGKLEAQMLAGDRRADYHEADEMGELDLLGWLHDALYNARTEFTHNRRRMLANLYGRKFR